MERLNMHTPDGVAQNIEHIGKLFPHVLTERLDDNGRPQQAIDFDLLRQELSSAIVEGPEERYQFNWPDKKKSILLANSPVAATLRPCREESVNFDSTENLYIEGDNLDVLKLLQETYLGKIKMIYIDPPYNTGNDFVYEDDFAENAADFLARDGQFDAQGNRLVQNTDSNGRFHTDWLNMIYPRLKLAKNLLTEDGVIFISIDDHEQENLKKICNEVFGEGNFVSDIILRSNPRGSQEPYGISREHEYLLCYVKSSLGSLTIVGEKRSSDDDEFSFCMENGNKARLLGLRKRGGDWRRADRPNMFYPLYVNPLNNKVSTSQTQEFSVEVFPLRPDGEESRWTWGPVTAKERIAELYGKAITRNGELTYDIYRIDPLESLAGELKREKLKSVWLDKELNYQSARQYLKVLFNNSEFFDFPKPPELILKILRAIKDDNSIVLDFFSGSATTAHAVMQQNAEDGGRRKFIMVQLPEACPEGSEAYKAGYLNICEIGKERIRRAGRKIAEENAITAPDLDIGFRVLKLDSTNMKDVYYTPEKTYSDELPGLVSNIKEDRTAGDLLFQVMLELGILLSSPIEERTIAGRKVFAVDGNTLIACFEPGVTAEVITELARLKPYYFVLRDSSLADDSVAANFEQIFASISPGTVRRIL